MFLPNKRVFAKLTRKGALRKNLMKEGNLFYMSSLSRHWRLLDSSSLSKPDYYQFTHQFTLANMEGAFAIIAETLPLVAELRGKASRSNIGAHLAIKAAQIAFNELLDKKLNFVEMFFSLFSKHWQAAVLLHAIENPITNKQGKNTQKEILEYYNPSIALLYQFDQQLILLQLGYAQIALLNQRYNCEIKKVATLSLSDFLVNLEQNTEPPLQLIDLAKDKIIMVALLSQHYISPKTVTRLNTNIIKLYRQFEVDKHSKHLIDNLIILKQEYKQTDSKTSDVVEKKATQINQKAKKKLTSTLFLLLGLISATSASYYLWQVQATETNSLLPLGQPIKKKEEIIEKDKILLSVDQEQVQITTIKQKQWLEKQKLKKQQQQAIIKAKELEQQKAREQERIEAMEKIYAQQRKEAELRRLEQERIDAQLEADALQQEKIRQEAKLKQQKQLKNEEISLLSIKKDIELIAWNNEKDHAQEVAEQQKRRTQYELKKQQEQRKRAQEAKIKAKKQAEKRRLDALIKQRREEFARNKRQQKQQVTQTATIETVAPKQRLQQQRQTQHHIKQQAEEKKRNILVELKKQQQKQAKAKDFRQRLKQQTVVHQLISYSKTFHRHTLQLKQKLNIINALEKRADAFSHPKIIRERGLFKKKEATIRKRLDSLAKLYSDKLKRLCANPKLYPVKLSATNPIERTARSIIAQQLHRCSQSWFISTKGVTTTLLNRYLK